MSALNKRPLLSISLMSNGKKNTVRKCLDSLMPIMNAIPCELIIVDTGCDEKTAAILHEYTDQVLLFAWCNDFSKARNIGLEKASGEWFMYIDDDEWFEDVTEIIGFFKTGEYKQYGYANYIVRNYQDYEEHAYNDTWVSRLIKLSNDTRFLSPIHEYLWPINGKCKLLNCYAKHFGYVFDTEEEKIIHSQRNISLLVEVVQKESDNIRWWIQLAQEYFTIKNWDKVQTICLEALEQFKDVDIYNVNNFRGTFYLGLVMKSILQQEYASAEKYYQMALNDKRNTNMCKAMLYARMAELYYIQRRYDECSQCCEDYMQLYEILHDDENACFIQGSFFTSEACKINIRNNVYSFYIKCCVEKGNIGEFIMYFWKIGWDAEMMNIYHTFITDVLDGFATLPYTDEFVKMAQTMMDRNGVNRLTIERLQQIEREDKEKFAALYRIFEQVDSPAIIKNPKPVQKKPEVTDEMQQLATQIKGQIQVLLDQGMYKEASVVLAQLKTFVPLDEEMAVMEQQINENLTSI